MKRFIALALSLLFILSLCACTDSGSGTPSDNTSPKATEVISKELQGKWYGPNNQPELDINADGTGKVTLNESSFDATFSADNKVFTATSEGYSITGEYLLENEKLTITAAFDGKEYIVIFTRNPVTPPEDSYIYNYNGETYEINFTEGTVVLCEFPPSDTPDIIKVYFYVDGTVIHVYPDPPINGETTTATSTTKPQGPDFPIPEEIDTGKVPPEIKIGDDTATGYTSNDDITGTWTTLQDGTISFFGVTNETTVPITYTFNADGTGTILAMGIFPGTMTYSVENGVLNLIVSMLGDTESGTGYVKRVGDILYVKNLKGEILALTRQSE